MGPAKRLGRDAGLPAAGGAGRGVRLGTGGHRLLILAFGVAPAATLKPFSYLQIAFATLLGGAVFGLWPDGWSLAGMAVIAASGATAVWLDVREAPQPGRAAGARGR